MDEELSLSLVGRLEIRERGWLLRDCLSCVVCFDRGSEEREVDDADPDSDSDSDSVVDSDEDEDDSELLEDVESFSDSDVDSDSSLEL